MSLWSHKTFMDFLRIIICGFINILLGVLENSLGMRINILHTHIYYVDMYMFIHIYFAFGL